MNLMKSKAVAEFVSQWFEDFDRTIKRYPSRYRLLIAEEPTEDGDRMITTIYDNLATEETDRDAFTEAICNETDDYDFKLGIAIAWAKMFHINLPTELKPKKYGDLKNVKTGMRFRFPDDEKNIYHVLSTSIDHLHDDTLLITTYNEHMNWHDLFTVSEKTPKAERKIIIL